jgi:diaminopimelate epimerase
MKMRFTKMHGTGNDYVYVNCMDQALPHPEKISQYISHRRFSIGSDGLICICPSEIADFRMRMFNADASEGKMCGNGTRCIAKYVYDKGLTKNTSITLETLSGIKKIDMTLGADGLVAAATVDMGEPIIATKQIPMICDKPTFIDGTISLVKNPQQKVRGTAVSMGNPHFVIFVDDVDNFDVEGIGRQIEKHPLFPEQTNTEFVQVLDKNSVKFRVWERGSGETWACGTGACAVAFTAINLGKAGHKGEFLNVHAKGGDLRVMHNNNNHMILQGPAVTAFEGEIEIPDELLK